jgi:hypothetical protein
MTPGFLYNPKATLGTSQDSRGSSHQCPSSVKGKGTETTEKKPSVRGKGKATPGKAGTSKAKGNSKTSLKNEKGEVKSKFGNKSSLTYDLKADLDLTDSDEEPLVNLLVVVAWPILLPRRCMFPWGRDISECS